MYRSLFFIALATAFCAVPAAETKAQEGGQNAVKANLLPLLGGTFAVEYERALTQRLTLGAMFSTRPEKALPFMSTIKSVVVDDDPDLEDILDKTTLGATSFAVEGRFYTGKKGAFRGFYLAPYFKVAKYALGMPISAEYDEPSLGIHEEAEIMFKGNLNATTVGLGFGLQYTIGNRVTVDWRIIGPGYGKGKGTISGRHNRDLSADLQEEFRKEIEDLLGEEDVPFIKIKDVEVGAREVGFRTDSPWAGIRTGLSVGFRF